MADRWPGGSGAGVAGAHRSDAPPQLIRGSAGEHAQIGVSARCVQRPGPVCEQQLCLRHSADRDWFWLGEHLGETGQLVDCLLRTPATRSDPAQRTGLGLMAVCGNRLKNRPLRARQR
jgi:hypothetical protein